MTASIPYLFVPVFSWPGAPGGKLHTYQAGSSSTPQTTYAEDGVTPNLNPVTLDSTGSAIVRLDPTLAYHFILKDSTDTTTLWDADTYQSQYLSAVNTVDSGAISYARTAAEIAAAVTPTNYAYPELHFLRYGITGSASDQSALIQSAIAVAAVNGGILIAPKPSVSYNLGTTGITVPANVVIQGIGSEVVLFIYSGTGYAIDHSGAANGLVNLYVQTSAAAGNGIRFKAVSRHSILDRMTTESTYTPASGRTGTGFTFSTASGDSGFSGFFRMSHSYSLGYKFGMKCSSFELGSRTWTSIVGDQIFIVGPGAGICAGSIGIWFDATTNGVGSAIYGGTIEGFEVPIQIDNGGFGLNYYGDIEGNTSNTPVLGASYCGEIVIHPAGIYHRRAANATANVWFKERHLNGVLDRESRGVQRITVTNANGTEVEFGFFRGASAIDGGTPTLALGLHASTDDDLAAPERNWIIFGARKMTWGSAAPTSGTWSKGDITWNTGVAAAGSPGWVCTTAGTPGTWKAMANVAA